MLISIKGDFFKIKWFSKANLSKLNNPILGCGGKTASQRLSLKFLKFVEGYYESHVLWLLVYT